MLPRGITGFRAHSDAPLPLTDVRAFRGHCHAAALHAGGQVVSVVAPNLDGVCRNFAVGVFSLPAGEVVALLNAHHPLIAFADPFADDGIALRFRDCTVLAAAFESLGVYRIASAAELEAPPNPAAFAELSEVERKQIADWNPQRLGDLAFNWWD